MVEVTWHPRALDNLNEIAEFISAESRVSAERFVERAFRATERLVNFPKSGRVFPGDDSGLVREIVVGNYRMAYRLYSREIQVLSVFHDSRDLGLEDLPLFTKYE